jgi:hypothetical protein
VRVGGDGLLVVMFTIRVELTGVAAKSVRARKLGYDAAEHFIV